MEPRSRTTCDILIIPAVVTVGCYWAVVGVAYYFALVRSLTPRPPRSLPAGRDRLWNLTATTTTTASPARTAARTAAAVEKAAAAKTRTTPGTAAAVEKAAAAKTRAAGTKKADASKPGPISEGRLQQLVSRGDYSNALANSQWAEYQARVAARLAAGLDEAARAPMRTLLATSVGNQRRIVDLWSHNVRKLAGNTAGDRFDFAFFHYDGKNSLYQEQAWYRGAAVKVRRLEPGCPAMNWYTLEPDSVRRYAYIWLSDEDLHLGFFSWELYRTILRRLKPLVSQPAVVGARPWAHATMVKGLRVPLRGARRYGDDAVLVTEFFRSETMTPILDTRIWPAFHATLNITDRRDTWFTDAFWDIPANAAKRFCSKPAIALVQVSPTRHMNWKTLKNAAKAVSKPEFQCMPSAGDHRRIRGPLSPTQAGLLAEGLSGHCDKAASEMKNSSGKPMLDVANGLVDANIKHLRSWTLKELAR